MKRKVQPPKHQPPTKKQFKYDYGSTESDSMKGLYVPPSVALSKIDRPSQLILSQDQLRCRGTECGYSLIRATHGVHSGGYYWECEIMESKCADAHYRIGWSARFGELQAPVGYDKHSFGYRDLNGSKVHNRIRDDTYGESYGVGDVVGCYIFLDDWDVQRNVIHFFKNGVDQGVAYEGKHIVPGVYFPAVSIYNEGEVRCNFGPTFIYPPQMQGHRHGGKSTNFPFTSVSDLQPLTTQERYAHEESILSIKKSKNLL